MKFMHRHRRVLSIVSLVVFLLTGSVTPAAAEYDPQLGRFIQRDGNGTGISLQPEITYYGENPVVTVSMAYELQFADGMNFYNYLRSNAFKHRDPSGLFTLAEIGAAQSLQATLSSFYMDVSASLVDGLKGIALLQSERYAVIDGMLGAMDPFDFSGIDHALTAYRIFEIRTLGVFAGVGIVKAGKGIFKMLAARAGGRSRLLQRVEDGTASMRRVFGFGRKSSPIPHSYIKPKYSIDMRKAPATMTNAAGFPRNKNWFWNQMQARHRRLFSEKNRSRIANRRPPIVDDTWIKYYPEHKSFMGDTLIHHHINQGPIATPLPQAVHRSWTKVLHPGVPK